MGRKKTKNVWCWTDIGWKYWNFRYPTDNDNDPDFKIQSNHESHILFDDEGELIDDLEAWTRLCEGRRCLQIYFTSEKILASNGGKNSLQEMRGPGNTI